MDIEEPIACCEMVSPCFLLPSPPANRGVRRFKLEELSDLETSSGPRRRQQLLQPRRDHLECHTILTPMRHDHVRTSLGRLDELQMHRSHCRPILTNDILQRSPTLPHVPPQSADEANI